MTDTPTTRASWRLSDEDQWWPLEHGGADWTLFLCDDCWADAAIESNLKSLWDTIPQPQP